MGYSNLFTSRKVQLMLIFWLIVIAVAQSRTIEWVMWATLAILFSMMLLVDLMFLSPGTFVYLPDHRVCFMFHILFCRFRMKFYMACFPRLCFYTLDDT